MSRLVIFEGERQLAEHDLLRTVVGLGRHPQNDIVLDDRTLSRFHARIEKRDFGFVVMDLGAQNGVHLNGERIEKEAELVSGDRIDLGRYTAVFEDVADVSPRVTVAAPQADDDDLDLDIDLGDDLDDDDHLGLGGSDLGRDIDDLNARTGLSVDHQEFSEASQVEYVAPQPTFVVLFNGMEVSRHPYADEGLVIGRSKQCEIVISLLGLSRRHAQVSTTDQGIAVEDLGSQNGTWVNNERIEGQHVLRHGDLLNFYDYGVLFLEDGDVDVGFPGADFASAPSTQQQSAGQRDDLSAQETDRAINPPTSVPRLRQATRRSPILDVPAEDPGGFEETERARERPPGRGRRNTDSADSHLNLDDLGEGSFLGDEFEDGASKARQSSNDLVDLLDDDEPPRAPASNGMGTELIEGVDVSRGALDEDLEADIAFSASAALDDDFTGPSTAGDLHKLADRTSAGIEINGITGGWPNEDELDRALMVMPGGGDVTLDVTMRGRPYTQVPLSQLVARLGSDARCELSMPKTAGLRPWHLTFSRLGNVILCVRSNKNAVFEHNGNDVDVALLRDGDTIKAGKVEITLRFR